MDDDSPQTRAFPSWDDPTLRPASESGRTARHRRLQSWYREVQLDVPPGPWMNYPALGSYLDPAAVAEQRDLNFLHPAAHEHAEQRAVEVQSEGGSLEPQRLFHNMLSSMPLCFNLFGAMRGNRSAFLPVFQRLFDAEASTITEIICEWSPPDAPARIGDRTAFDAVIFYTAGGEQRFVGIETKYTEPFSAKPYDTATYRTVTAQSPWFRTGADVEQLVGPKVNQLWRNTMLAASLDAHGSRGRGSLAVVALADDSGVPAAAEPLKAQLSPDHQGRVKVVTIESILETVHEIAPSLARWATSFERRYLATSLPDDPSAARDPDGPQFGRPLLDPR